MTHRFGAKKDSEAVDLLMIVKKGKNRHLFTENALKKLVMVAVDYTTRKEPMYLVEYKTSHGHTVVRVNTKTRHEQALRYGVPLYQETGSSPINYPASSPSPIRFSPVNSPASSPSKSPSMSPSPIRFSPVNSPASSPSKSPSKTPSPIRFPPASSPEMQRTIVALVKMSHKAPSGSRVYTYFQSFGFDSSNNPIYEEITKPHYDTLLKSHPHLRRTSKRSKGANARVRCSKKSRVVELTYDKNPKTKRNVYKAICADGGSRIITRTQYERYAKRSGMIVKELPVKRVSKRLPKRSNTVQYCDAYGNFYHGKCMTIINNKSECDAIRTGRVNYCNEVGGRTKVSNRGCDNIGGSTKEYNLHSRKYPKTESEAESRARHSLKNCERARRAAKTGKYTVTARPKPRKSRGILGALGL